MLDGILNYFPFVYALVAGMVTMVSPCSVAMLPPYISLYLVDTEAGGLSRAKQVVRASYFSLVVTGGYVLLSVVIGAVTGIAGEFLLSVVPWLAVFVGVILVVLGGWLLAGGHFGLGIFSRAAVRVQGIRTGRFLGYLLFGVAYGMAALSCSFPVFLMVVISAFVARGFVSGALQFLFYSLGMAIVFVGVALTVTFLKEAVQRWLIIAVPLVNRIGGGLLVISGGYIIYYWLKVGDLFGLAGV